MNTDTVSFVYSYTARLDEFLVIAVFNRQRHLIFLTDLTSSQKYVTEESGQLFYSFATQSFDVAFKSKQPDAKECMSQW